MINKKIRRALCVLTLIAMFFSWGGIYWVNGYPEALAAELSLTQSKPGNIFYESETKSFTVNTDGDSIHWTTYDYLGEKVLEGTQAVSGGAANLIINTSKKGWFELKIQARQSGVTTNELTTNFAIIPDDDGINDERFYVQTHMGRIFVPDEDTKDIMYNTDVLPLVKKVGAAGVRDANKWRYMETGTKGAYVNPTQFSDMKAALDTNGLDIIIPAAYGNYLYDSSTEYYMPDSEEMYAGYTNYILKLLENYGSTIKAIEIWNEPDSINFAKGPGANPQNYAELCKRVYNAVKPLYPDMKIVGGVTKFVDHISFAWLESVFQAGGLQYLDTVSVHYYPKDPTQREGDYTTLNNLIKTYNNGISKPIWVTESGWTTYPANKTFIPEAPLQKQAEMVVKTYAVAFGNGVERLSWFNFKNLASTTDSEDKEHFFGLIRHENDPKGKYVPNPSYASYAVLTNQLGEYVFDTEETTIDPGIKSYRFLHGSNEKRIMWAQSGAKNVTIETSNSITVTDLMGNEQTYMPDNGHVYLTLSAQPVYVSGNVSNLESGFVYEAETLPYTLSAGDTRDVFLDAGLSGGHGFKLNANAVGDYVNFTANVPEAGTYRVEATVKKYNNRGKYNVSIAGAAAGAEQNQFSATGEYETQTLGYVKFTDKGNKQFQFTVTGKDDNSVGYTLAFDCIKLLPENTETKAFECESSVTVTSSGDSSSIVADPTMSNGQGTKFNDNAVGDYIQFEVNVPETKTYTVKVSSKTHSSRGIMQLLIDGVNIGAPIDCYAATSNLTQYSLGEIALTAGIKQFKFAITGKNVNSTGYTLFLDNIVLSPLFEAEALNAAVSAGDTHVIVSDPLMTGGAGDKLNANAVEDFIQYDNIYVPVRGAYNISVRVKTNAARGIFQMSVDGSDVGGLCDNYNLTDQYIEFDLGRKEFTCGGNKQFKFTVKGKNADATGYTLLIDSIKLIPTK